jgi:TonB family protein
MFEKVTCRRAERRAFLHLHGVSASMAAHAVGVLGVTALSLAGAAADDSVETATYLLLQPPRAVSDLPSVHASPSHRDRAASAHRAARPVAPRPRPTASVAAPSPPVGVAELALAAPPAAVKVMPPSGQAIDALLLRGLGDARPGAAGGAGHSLAATDDGGAAPVVESALLAMPPSIMNRNTITRVMSNDYPDWMLDRGIEGEVVVSFIIGVDGRAEMDHVEVVSATRREFIHPAMRGLRLMRFRPAELDGRRVRVRVTLPLRWRLGSVA